MPSPRARPIDAGSCATSVRELSGETTTASGARRFRARATVGARPPSICNGYSRHASGPPGPCRAASTPRWRAWTPCHGRASSARHVASSVSKRISGRRSRRGRPWPTSVVAAAATASVPSDTSTSRHSAVTPGASSGRSPGRTTRTTSTPRPLRARLADRRWSDAAPAGAAPTLATPARGAGSASGGSSRPGRGGRRRRSRRSSSSRATALRRRSLRSPTPRKRPSATANSSSASEYGVPPKALSASRAFASLSAAVRAGARRTAVDTLTASASGGGAAPAAAASEAPALATPWPAPPPHMPAGVAVRTARSPSRPDRRRRSGRGRTVRRPATRSPARRPASAAASRKRRSLTVTLSRTRRTSSSSPPCSSRTGSDWPQGV